MVRAEPFGDSSPSLATNDAVISRLSCSLADDACLYALVVYGFTVRL